MYSYQQIKQSFRNKVPSLGWTNIAFDKYRVSSLQEPAKEIGRNLDNELGSSNNLIERNISSNGFHTSLERNLGIHTPRRKHF